MTCRASLTIGSRLTHTMPGSIHPGVSSMGVIEASKNVVKMCKRPRNGSCLIKTALNAVPVDRFPPLAHAEELANSV